MKKDIYALVLASGTGERTGLNIPKQFFKIKDKMLIEYSIEAFENNKNITHIIVVSHPDYINFVEQIIQKNKYKKVINVVRGGETRQESSFNGICVVPDDVKVLIHDAVRPFVSQDIINNCIEALNKYKAVGVAIPCADTIIEINNTKIIQNIPNRKTLMQIQTPQAFNSTVIKEAHKMLQNRDDIVITDDCGLIKNLNLCDIFIVDGDIKNIKITYPKDIALAEKLYEQTLI